LSTFAILLAICVLVNAKARGWGGQARRGITDPPVDCSRYTGRAEAAMTDVQACITQNPVQVAKDLENVHGTENAFQVLRNADPELLCHQGIALLECLATLVYAVPLECYDQMRGFEDGVKKFSLMTAGVYNLCYTELDDLKKHWQCFTDYELAKETFGCAFAITENCKAAEVVSCVGDKIDQSKTCQTGAREFNQRASAPFLTLVLPPQCFDNDDSSDESDDQDNGVAAVLPGSEKVLEFLQFFKK